MKNQKARAIRQQQAALASRQQQHILRSTRRGITW